MLVNKGITPTIIQVRVSIGLSSNDDEKLMSENSGSMHFQVRPNNSTSETGGTNEEARTDNET